jgi:hypothetical protein
MRAEREPERDEAIEAGDRRRREVEGLVRPVREVLLRPRMVYRGEEDATPKRQSSRKEKANRRRDSLCSRDNVHPRERPFHEEFSGLDVDHVGAASAAGSREKKM